MVQIRSKGELRVKMKRTVSCVSVCVVGVCDFVCETLCEEGVQYREKRENFVNFQPKSVICCLTIGRYKHDGEMFKFKLQSSGGFLLYMYKRAKKVGYCHQIKKS